MTRRAKGRVPARNDSMTSTLSRAARACGLAACLMQAPQAHAEDLVQVFDLARTHDASLAAAQALLRSARPRAEQAKAALRPSVNATASSTRSRYAPSTSDVDPVAEPVTSTSTTAALNLRQPLLNRAASVDVALAQVVADAAQADYDVVLQDFVLKVAQAYFDVLSAQDVLTTKQASKVSIGGQLESAARNFAAGTGIITDRQDAQARYDLAVSEVITAENDLRVRRLALERLTGRPGVAPARLAGSMMPVVTPPTLDEWLQLAREQPAIRRTQLALDSARLDTRRARASRWPTIDAVGSFGATRVTGGGSSATSATVAGRSRTTSVGIELNIPLFDGGSRQNRIAETLQLEEQAGQNLEAAIRSAADATERAYFDFQSAVARVKALEAAEASSRASLEGTEVGYRAGVRLNLDVLNAQTILFQTRSDLAKARYEVLMFSLRLRAAAGQLRPDSLLAVNRLLSS